MIIAFALLSAVPQPNIQVRACGEICTFVSSISAGGWPDVLNDKASDAERKFVLDTVKPYFDCTVAKLGTERLYVSDSDAEWDDIFEAAYTACEPSRESANNGIRPFVANRFKSLSNAELARLTNTIRSGTIVTILQQAFRNKGVEKRFDTYLNGVEAASVKHD